MENENRNNNANLEELLELTRENNKIIKRIRSTQKLQIAVRTIKFMILLILALAAYYFTKPIANTVVNDYKEIKGSLQNISSTSEKFGEFNKVLDIFKSITR